MDLEKNELRWGIEQRLEFIEFRLYWEGRVNRADLTQRFRISAPQASGDLGRYQELAPHNMEYDKSAKRYVATPRFQPVVLRPDSERYLDELQACADAEKQSWVERPVPVATVPNLKRSVPAERLRRIVSAIRSCSAVEIEYQSFSRPNPMWRWITPHALCFDGFRWHARSYCHRDTTFKDFVLSRVMQTGDLKPHEGDPLDDREWHETVTMVVGPHPEMTPSQRKAIELDYGMSDGNLRIEVRIALAYYVRKRFGLEDDLTTRRPQEQQIVLLNAKEVELRISEVRSS